MWKGFTVMLIVLATLSVGGCIFDGCSCAGASSACDPAIAPPQILGQMHCTDLLGLLAQRLPDSKFRGATGDGWYDLTSEAEVRRAVSSLVRPSDHIWVAIGKMKSWGKSLAIGWAFDSQGQRDLIAFVLHGGRILFFDPAKGWVNEYVRIFAIHI